MCESSCYWMFSVDTKSWQRLWIITPLQLFQSATLMFLLTLLGCTEGNRAPYTHMLNTQPLRFAHTHTHSMGRKYSLWRGEESGREGAVTESDSDQGLKEFSDVTCRLLLILLWHEIKCGERVTGDVLAACLVPRREWLMDNVLSNFCFNRSFIGNSCFDVLSYMDIQVGWLCVEMWWMCEECQLSVFCSRMLLWQGVCEICCWMLSVWGVCACCLGFNNATVYETFVRFVCVRAEFLRL